MPLAYDIELDGAGYMVAPGTYRRLSDGMPEGRAGRVVVKEFFGGQRRVLQLERDRSWDSEGVGPAHGGQGVEPWPFVTSHTDSVLNDAITFTTRAYALLVGGYCYWGIGRYLYRTVALSATSWANVTQVADMGAGLTISGLAYFRGDILIALGSGADIKKYTTGGGVLSTWSAGKKAKLAIGYARQLVWVDPTAGNEDELVIGPGSSTDVRQLDGPIVNLALHAGKVVAATRASLWLLGGKWDATANKWVGEPEPLFTHGVWTDDDDYVFLLSFGGRLYTWLAGQVMEFNPHGGSNRQGWRATGLEGRLCAGATVAANMLVVAILNRAGESELWAWDGSGWWLINNAGTVSERIWPAYVAGAGNVDLVAFRDGSASVTYDIHRLIYRDATSHAYPSSGAFVTSLLDAGERDKLKAWRAVGCTFATPEVRGNGASTDQVSVALAYSTDGGATFTTAATAAVSDPTSRTLDLEGAIASAAAVSRFLVLKVSWSSVLDWSPVLTGLWAEYELLDSPAKRRKWRFSVHARDATVQRDGSIAPRTGRQLAADLWTDWQAGATVAFKDVDHDATSATYQVRIVGIGEEIGKPSDGGRWGESVLSLTLVEV